MNMAPSTSYRGQLFWNQNFNAYVYSESKRETCENEKAYIVCCRPFNVLLIFLFFWKL